MTVYRLYIPPRSHLPHAAGVLSALLCCNTIYTLISMPHYTQYWDYWATLAASLLLSLACFFVIRRRPELVLIPAGGLALIACFSLNLVHSMELVLFFLLLLLLLLRLPRWAVPLFRTAGVLTAAIGVLDVLVPVSQRIRLLARTDRATADFVLPFLLRSLCGSVLCLLTLLLLIFAMRPHILPSWTDASDRYDRIWE